MKFSEEIRTLVSDRHLLKHEFYRAWDMGELDRDIIKKYAMQYSHNVDAFLKYVSATYTNADSPKANDLLYGNLKEEVEGKHPDLWKQFAEGMGATLTEIENEKSQLNSETQELIDTLLGLCKKSYASGIATLFVYEDQVPEICKTKISGLKNFYGVTDYRTYEYFDVHMTADVLHSEQNASLLDDLSEEDRAEAREASKIASLALWKFLDGMQKLRGTNCACTVVQ